MLSYLQSSEKRQNVAIAVRSTKGEVSPRSGIQLCPMALFPAAVPVLRGQGPLSRRAVLRRLRLTLWTADSIPLVSTAAKQEGFTVLLWRSDKVAVFLWLGPQSDSACFSDKETELGISDPDILSVTAHRALNPSTMTGTPSGVKVSRILTGRYWAFSFLMSQTELTPLLSKIKIAAGPEEGCLSVFSEPVPLYWSCEHIIRPIPEDESQRYTHIFT